jgi:integrase
MPDNFTFTLARLKALEPRDKVYTVTDTKTPTLSARVTPNGQITLQVRRRPKGNRKVVTVSICKLTDGIPLNDIRARVIEIVRLLNQGINPNDQFRQETAQRDAETKTLGEAYKDYRGKLHPYTHKPLSPNTLERYDRSIEKHLADWADQPMVSITPVMLLERFKQLQGEFGKGPAQCAATLVGACWTYANDMADPGDGSQLYGPPPLRLLNKMLPGWRKTAARTRKVGIKELPAWLAAVREEGGIQGAYFEALLLTGMRRRELAGLRWENVDMRRRRLHVPSTKNGEPLDLPITRRMMELLRWSRKTYPKSEYPLPALDPRGAAARIEKRCGVKFSPHDLRRTFTSLADNSGAGQYIIKGVLNHLSGGDVTGAHYAQHDVEDLHEPLQRIEDFILSKAKAHRDNVPEVVR